MTPQQKQARLKQLQKDPYLSDEEIEEVQRLVEELAIINNEPDKPEELVRTPKEAKLPTKPASVKKERRSLYSILKERFSEKPATFQEIEQLKLNAMRAELKARISKAKASGKQARADKLGQLLGTINGSSNSYRSREPRRRHNRTREDDKLSSANIRKAFWG